MEVVAVTTRKKVETDRDRDAIVDRLMARRAAIVHSVESLHDEAADAMEHRDLSDLYDIETVADADVGVTLTLATRAERYVAKLDDAIARVADGDYGLCTTCGANITQERLRALPATTKCVQCSRTASMAGRS